MNIREFMAKAKPLEERLFLKEPQGDNSSYVLVTASGTSVADSTGDSIYRLTFCDIGDVEKLKHDILSVMSLSFSSDASSSAEFRDVEVTEEDRQTRKNILITDVVIREHKERK